MKEVEIIPVYGKLDNTLRDIYCPISTLSNFTKIHESIVFVQLTLWKASFQKKTHRFPKKSKYAAFPFKND